jgi:hypothetical protein
VQRRTSAPDSTARADQTRSALVVTTLALCGTLVSLQQTLVVPAAGPAPAARHHADNASWLITATLLVGAVATYHLDSPTCSAKRAAGRAGDHDRRLDSAPSATRYPS